MLHELPDAAVTAALRAGFHTLCCCACCWPLFQAQHRALQIFGWSQHRFTALVVMSPGLFDGCPRLSHGRRHLLVTAPKMRGLQAQRAQLKLSSVFVTQSRAVARLASAEKLYQSASKFKSNATWENAAEKHHKSNLYSSPAHKAKRGKKNIYTFYKDQNYSNISVLQKLGL